MGCERDEVTLIQVFLLLSFWFETLSEEKNTRHWDGLGLFALCDGGFQPDLSDRLSL
jgi:hypothetical protein